MSAQKPDVVALMVLADEHASEIALSYRYPPPPVSCNPQETRDALEAHARGMTERITALEAQNAELLAALQASLLVIEDYLEYKHNGDPWIEDARTMGEMEINDFERDGRLESVRAVVAKATGSAS